MKKTIYVLFILGLLAFNAQAQVWNVAGGFNSWNNSGNPMYDDGTHGDVLANDSIFTTDITIATAGRVEYKVTTFGAWTTTYPAANSWIKTTTDNQVVKFTFNTKNLTDNWTPSTNIVNTNDLTAPELVAVGSHQGWNNAGTEIMHDDGLNGDYLPNDGIYTYHYVQATAGINEWKVVLKGTWDAWGSDNRSINANNASYVTDQANQHVYLHLNLATGRVYAKLNTPIPVELVSFTASQLANSIMLNWRTATEVNNKGFSIERRMDNGDYSEIGFVNGNGTTTNYVNYEFKDKVAPGKYYYRLKQHDFDGTYNYSSEIEVTAFSQVENESVITEFGIDQNYPNPFNPSTVISYQLPKGSFVTLKVYDMLGNEVKTLVNEYKEAGKYNVSFSGAALTSGVYFYKLQADSKLLTRKMNLIK